MMTCQLSVSWAKSIQSMPSHPISLMYSLILSSHLCLLLSLSSKCLHHNSLCISLLLQTYYIIDYIIIIIIIIITIIIIIIISFMQGIYTYIPETNYVPREYSVAAILLLLFMVLISSVSVLSLLNFYISTFRSMCAVPNVAVFCSSLTSCFTDMVLLLLLLLLSLLLPYAVYLQLCTWNKPCF